MSEDEPVPHRLITLAFSHYNEKARWALDRYAVPYREEPHMPFVSSLAVALATRGRGGTADRASSRYSTPVLILNDRRVLTDSTDILRFAGRRDSSFLPSGEVTELVAHYGDRLGPYTRLLAYWHLGRHRGMIEQLAADNVGRRDLAPGLCLTPEEGFGAILPDRASLDEEAQSLIREVRTHPAGQFALRVYAEERRRVLP